MYIKKIKEPYLTENDRKRIANIDCNPFAVNRKIKVEITLKHPKIDSLVCIIVYGKDKDDLKKKITEHLKYFQANDNKWKLIKVIDLKKD